MDAAAALEALVDLIADAVAQKLAPSEDRVLTVADMADRLHASEATVRRWCVNNVIPARRIGNEWMVTERRFHDWLSPERGTA